MCQICVCYSNIYYMKVKQLEADYRLFNTYFILVIGKITDRLIGKSAQHYKPSQCFV